MKQDPSEPIFPHLCNLLQAIALNLSTLANAAVNISENAAERLALDHEMLDQLRCLTTLCDNDSRRLALAYEQQGQITELNNKLAVFMAGQAPPPLPTIPDWADFRTSANAVCGKTVPHERHHWEQGGINWNCPGITK